VLGLTTGIGPWVGRGTSNRAGHGDRRAQRSGL